MTDILKSDIKNIIKGINKKDYSIEELVNHFIKKVDSLDNFNLVSAIFMSVGVSISMT